MQQKIGKIFFIVVLACAISTPLVATVFQCAPPKVPLWENRELRTLPDLKKTALYKWPAALTTYGNDQLGFRSQAISNYVLLWENFLSAPVNRYFTGRSGEFFLTFISPTVEPFLGIGYLTPEDIRTARIAFAGTQALFKKLGVSYLLVTVPDKPFFFSDFFPFWSYWKRGASRYAQIEHALRLPALQWLDLAPVLRTTHQQLRVYNKWYDVEHWNGTGIISAHHAIVAKLQAMGIPFTPAGEQDFTIVPRFVSSYAYGSESVPFVKMQELERFYDRSSEKVLYKKHTRWNDGLLIENSSVAQGAVWLLCDSYLASTHCMPNAGLPNNILPLASLFHSFLRTHYTDFSLQIIKTAMQELKPSIVIEEVAEREFLGAIRLRYNTLPVVRILGDAVCNILSVTIPAQTVSPGAAITLPPVVGECGSVIGYVRAPASGRVRIDLHVEYADGHTTVVSNAASQQVEPGASFVHCFFSGVKAQRVVPVLVVESGEKQGWEFSSPTVALDEFIHDVTAVQ